MAGMGKFIKQAKKMQEQMDKLQKELENSLIEVEAGGGSIKINITGTGQLNSLSINPEIIDPEDAEGLEDLILTAVNQAIKTAKDYSDEKSNELTGDLPLPQGLKF